MGFENGIELLQQAGSEIGLLLFSLLTETIGFLRGLARLVGFCGQRLLLRNGGGTRLLGFGLGFRGFRGGDLRFLLRNRSASARAASALSAIFFCLLGA